MSESLVSGTDQVRLGFYGKLPARGDFVTRRLARGFVEPWDAWLQGSLMAVSEQLGEGWLPAYLEAPPWRFVIGPGICGDVPMAGVIMPSVDRVGRYFPLTLAAPADDCRTPASTAVAGAEWFERVENLALSALADDADFDAFDKASEMVAALAPVSSGANASDRGVVLNYEGSDSLMTPAIQLCDGVLTKAGTNWALWWTTGSERVRPSMVMTKDLPTGSGFAAFLDGKWERWGWVIR